ncbi:UNVERIFIED_CONTAM: bifunctional 4-hydroxy-2-oxoglutarate aldolase/2-dehydro-3-deoxy-phosphogluconate aldolase [Streptococcus canis]|uniref:Keto-hydroxyglutarate-aldolase/keto-deoxy-phosphogluconate aldolase n=1 Tax=Streptococcus canis FSL Z3-227 TaxID=482234 RepID=A0AAV3FR06_STRCB|nr:bifunctional 4-hydroxy-2-oxoglutarate aldolase/2-dehydro-3-deoxy-phosphogluconate aldolase [Streptococcus canis]EIQ81552.1 keto-hydroxyglutarate-aldolase/keto-deoxy-phosphogluconate aldolase [Streptococcus canis FSL Z3-227]MDV5988247.1 bifunctional 4-hydroxy-2-oxoglutarate aldolase/2-dehydro-3-deoxy-phosphogluconate aldolase [Streptococcus canis]MDV5994169.1 bifunctional 4-hydroxy-2-oxoglutarate aldolase/2-dehydro-3-deoxy-phosphogluconate aldolase [Streptococcus canis]MDV6000624.1 bifunction
MGKIETLTKLKANRLVLVVRGESSQEALACSLASIEGGIKTIEVTYTNPFASEVIGQLAERFKEDTDVLIGAGTILDDITARQAILAGAQFIVGPNFNQAVERLCHRYGVPYLPGCMTVTEVVTALESGVDMVKLFPGSTVGMPFIQAIKSPLPQVEVMVTGGVNEGNVTDWLAAGAQVLGIGGEFNRLASQGKFETITQRAAMYVKLAKDC